MNSESFVLAVKKAVHDSAVADVVEAIMAPSGRRPPESELRLSVWYNGLSENDQRNVQAMVLHGVHAALFGFFAVLDGVRVIEDSEEKSDFAIVQRRGGVEHVITDAAMPLHDIYQAEVWDEVFGDRQEP